MIFHRKQAWLAILLWLVKAIAYIICFREG